MYGDKFEKGMFLTNPNQKGTFFIFEGIDISTTQYTKKYSVVAAYDPHKYCRESDTSYVYTYKEWFDYANNEERCSETVNETCETSWIRQCTAEEKEQAINVLHEYGYDWSDEMLALIDMESGEIVRKIPCPSNEYNGDIIFPLNDSNKGLLHDYVESINKPKLATTSCNHVYDEAYWNRYNDYDDYYYD